MRENNTEVPRIHLEPRQEEVLRLIISGYTYDQVGAALHIENSTVSSHLRNARFRNNCDKTMDLVLLYIKNIVIDSAGINEAVERIDKIKEFATPCRTRS